MKKVEIKRLKAGYAPALSDHLETKEYDADEFDFWHDENPYHIRIKYQGKVQDIYIPERDFYLLYVKEVDNEE